MAEHVQWEYKTARLGTEDLLQAERQADDLGSDGWELVTVEDGVWIFKRLKEDNGAAVQTQEAAELLSQTVPVVVQTEEEATPR